MHRPRQNYSRTCVKPLGERPNSAHSRSTKGIVLREKGNMALRIKDSKNYEGFWESLCPICAEGNEIKSRCVHQDYDMQVLEEPCPRRISSTRFEEVRYKAIKNWKKIYPVKVTTGERAADLHLSDNPFLPVAEPAEARLNSAWSQWASTKSTNGVIQTEKGNMAAIFKTKDNNEDLEGRLCLICLEGNEIQSQCIHRGYSTWVMGNPCPRRVYLTNYEEVRYEATKKQTNKGKGIYRLKVTTAARGERACRAKVFIKLKGLVGDTEYLSLVKPRLHSFPFTFAVGSKEVFYFITSPLIAINSIDIKLESDTRDQWFLDSMELLDISASTKYTFLHNNWLVTDGISPLHLELRPTSVEEIMRQVKDQNEEEADEESEQGAKGKHNLYRIMVEDNGYRNIESIMVQLKGHFGKMKPSELIKRTKSYFPVGQHSKKVEIFFVRCKDLGILESLEIKAKDIYAYTVFQSISIIDVRRKLFYLFNRDGRSVTIDGASSTDSVVQLRAQKQEKLKNDLNVDIITGDKAFAGTDSDIQIILFGLLGRKSLNICGRKTDSVLERGSTKNFRLLADVGPIQKIRIIKDMEGKSPDWYLEKILIREDWETPIVFSCGRWIPSDLEKDEKCVYIDIYPVSDDNESEDGKVHLTPYDVLVETGNITNAGTDANVFITLIGNSLYSPEIQLDNREINFDVGQTDDFKVKTEDVGQLQAINIRHDNTSLSPGWFLKKVVVKKYHTDEDNENYGRNSSQGDESETSGIEIGRRDFSGSESRRPAYRIYKEASSTREAYFTKYTFRCNRWLAEDEDDGAISLKLEPTSSITYYKDRI